MSSYGEIHFLEVKRIFISLIVIALVFIIANLFYIFLCKLKMRSSYKNIIKNLNSGSNILIIFL